MPGIPLCPYNGGGAIDKGELRIGLRVLDVEQFFDRWYHPECLWKTFEYRRGHGNPRITSIDQIVGIGSLEQEDVKKLQDLIDKHSSRKKKKQNDDGDGGEDGSPKKKKKCKTTTFIEQLRAEYEAAMQQQQQQQQDKEPEEAGDTSGDRAAAVPAHRRGRGGEGKETDKGADKDKEGMPLHQEGKASPLALYGHYHKMRIDELKEILRWNRQILKGTKAVILHKVLDGMLHGP